VSANGDAGHTLAMWDAHADRIKGSQSEDDRALYAPTRVSPLSSPSPLPPLFSVHGENVFFRGREGEGLSSLATRRTGDVSA